MNRRMAMGMISLCLLSTPGCGPRTLRMPPPRPAPVLPGAAVAPPTEAPASEGRFPSMAALSELAAQTPPASQSAEAPALERPWTFRGPLPDQVGDLPVARPTPAHRLLIETLGGSGLVMATEGAECAAREVAHHLVEHNDLGTPAFHRAVAAACGLPVSSFGLSTVVRSARPGETEAGVLAADREKLRSLLTQQTGSGPRQAGFFVGILRGKVAAVLVTHSRLAELAPVARRGEQGIFELRGTLMQPADRIRALATRGTYGYHECAQDERVVLPAFVVRCEVDPADSQVLVSVAAFPPGRILGENVALVEVWPAGAPTQAFVPPPPASDPPGLTVRQALLDGLNRLRAQAGLEPLRLASEQSDLADQLVPHYFAALAGQASATDADRVALGMLAGWLVPAMVNGAATTSDSTTHPGIEPLLRTLYSLPSGRAALFDPDARFVAVGVLPEGGGHRALIATYHTVSPEDARVAAQHELDQVFAQLEDARKAAGLGPPTRIELTTEDFNVLGRRLEAHELDSTQNTLMGLVRSRLRTSVMGWTLQTHDVDAVDFPPELVQAPQLAVGLTLAYLVQPPEPWARRVIFMVMSTVPVQAPELAAAYAPP
jgi:hypothetical protein